MSTRILLEKMLTHEKLMESWSADCRIDSTALLDRMYRHPLLHSKYLTILQSYKVQQRKLTLKYQKNRLQKTRYFNGELTQDELLAAGWKQYLFRKPMKAEMETLLDADSDLQLLQEQILYIETLIQSTESIMKDISNQYFLFKNLIEQTKFLNGG